MYPPCPSHPPPAPTRIGSALARYFAVAAVSLLIAAGKPARGQESPPVLPPEPAAPLVPSAPLRGEYVFTYPGLHILLGDHFLAVRGEGLNRSSKPGGGFSDGASVGLDWVGEYFRVGYLRQAYRDQLSRGTRYRGVPVSLLAIDADQVWGYAGLRPWRSLYLGAGLGAQRRRIRFTPRDPADSPVVKDESLLSLGFILEYALLPPFLVQLRYTSDLPGGAVEVTGTTLVLAYVVPL